MDPSLQQLLSQQILFSILCGIGKLVWNLIGEFFTPAPPSTAAPTAPAAGAGASSWLQDLRRTLMQDCFQPLSQFQKALVLVCSSVAVLWLFYLLLPALTTYVLGTFTLAVVVIVPVGVGVVVACSGFYQLYTIVQSSTKKVQDQVARDETLNLAATILVIAACFGFFGWGLPALYQLSMGDFDPSFFGEYCRLFGKVALFISVMLSIFGLLKSSKAAAGDATTTPQKKASVGSSSTTTGTTVQQPHASKKKEKKQWRQ